MRSVRRALAAIALLLSVALPARADEIAPELETADLRSKAQAELKRLTTGLDPKDQKRLTGLYLAFAPDSSDPVAQVACDDDGDYVIVLSDAMLRLASNVARAAAYDDGGASRSIDDYAGFLSRSQIPGRRLLPPPPGFYIAQKPAPTYDERLAEILSFVIARELTHLRAGDHVCAHPTATKESGDDEWTSSEQRRASEAAAIVYPGRIMERDTEATVRMLDAGRSERGALALLRFFSRLEIERLVAIGRWYPTYSVHHPSPVARAATVRATAEAHQGED